MEMTSMFQIGQIVGMIILAALFVIMIKADVKILRVEMKAISKNLELLNTAFSQLSQVLSRSDVADTRIARLEEDVRDLRHGRGFIQDDVNGEYGPRGKIKER
jgi:hypothetical protein